ncbi:SDR family NAD(P)-dependent oxidoreductase [Modestobacter caceresii]|jgi:NAD(P)-dependent dehydrogenase (short-subunit alcohol dehydrogenase family)|nr:SDR family oxidoreductase [Modestobacter caceresii]
MTGSTGDTRSLPERLRMDDRHVLVTGAASGLGLGIVEGLLQCGASVTMLDVDADQLARSAATVDPAGGTVTTRVCDVSRADEVHAVVTAAAAERPLDAVFANAGIAGGPGVNTPEGRVYDLDWAAFDAALAVNLVGTLATVRAAASAMRPVGRGSIVVTVSTAGLRADSMVGYGYSASKGALANLVRQAAVDLAPDGIRVNGIAPGPFHTNIGGRGPIDPAVEQAWADTVLLGRMAVRQELQGMALLLASDASSFMTGTVYPVDGGALAGAF